MTREIGTRGRHVRFERGRGRWPTLRGENPPQGVPYEQITVWLWPSSLTFHLRWYRWKSR